MRAWSLALAFSLAGCADAPTNFYLTCTGTRVIEARLETGSEPFTKVFRVDQDAERLLQVEKQETPICLDVCDSSAFSDYKIEVAHFSSHGDAANEKRISINRMDGSFSSETTLYFRDEYSGKITETGTCEMSKSAPEPRF